MKLFKVILAYVVIGAVLGWGIYQVTQPKGSWGILGLVFAGYVIWFGKVGCLPKSGH